MALRGIYGYRHPDPSLDYNTRTAKIIDRAILDGGTVSYTGSLVVRIAPFIAHTVDGLVVLSSDTEQLTLVDNQVNYLVCFARYQPSSDPLIQMRVVTELEWASSINRSYFITFAKFDLVTDRPLNGFALVDATFADYSESDYSDKLGKSVWRSPSATVAALPTTQNRTGDTRLALDNYVSYTWNGTAWVATKTVASSVVSSPYGPISATNVQTAIQQLASLSAASNFANNVVVTPAGSISSVNVQAALEELDTEKASLASANTFLATQTVTATGLNTSKLVVNNSSTEVAAHWAKLVECTNALNHLRLDLAGSDTTAVKKFQFSLNSSYNSATSSFTADNPGSSAGYEAGLIRYESTDHKLTLGYRADTTSAWLETDWFKTDLICPKTSNLALTIRSDGQLATDPTVVLSDRYLNTSVAMNSQFYIPFNRKFNTVPTTVNLGSAGPQEANVQSITVNEITVLGFRITVIPTVPTSPGTPAVFTVDRTWTTT